MIVTDHNRSVQLPPGEAPHLVLMDRLTSCVSPFFGWVTRVDVMNHRTQVKYLDLRLNVDHAWHLGRVRYFVERIDDGWVPDPIEIESRVYSPHPTAPPVWCGPMIVDGQHRYAAAAICHLLTIPATFGGVVTTIRWLTGVRNRRPPELRL